MIRVDVEEYCQQCLDFSPEVIKPIRVSASDGKVTFTDTVIQCKYRKRCCGMMRYLKTQVNDKDA